MVGPGIPQTDSPRGFEGLQHPFAREAPEVAVAPCPPRLCEEDLPHPEAYHQRLLDWLALQR